MALDLGSARPQGWSQPGRTTREIATGGWRTRRPVYVEATAPCRPACPAGEPIARWIERVRRGDLAEAWRLLREENPLPAVTGRVCGHPCEAACNRRAHDGAVSINALERFVGDWGLEHGRVLRAAVTRPERVAVVGGGPAGLACAYHLARRGYGVTLHEREARLGGLLRSGIPEYRLPRTVLDRELELVIGVGIEVVTGQGLGDDLTWEALADYDAVFVATGAPLPLPLGVPGADARGVGDGLAFLRDVNAGRHRLVGGRLVVVGGGSTAIDVARSARRLGGVTVTVVALERRDAMPALPEEVEQALAEGIHLVNGVGVAGFVDAGGVVTGVVVAGARIERAPDGTIRPVLDGGARRIVPADQVLLAIGQRPELAPLTALETAGHLVAVDGDGATSTPGVFAGGDLASPRRTVAHAVGSGTRAARAIHARLADDPDDATAAPAAGTEARAYVVAPDRVDRSVFPAARRAVRWDRLPHERVQAFIEVVGGLTERAALAEAERCFSCGRCVTCDRCLAACPDMAITRTDGAYRVALEHCKGCGLCVAECPRGALEMADER
jgi:NADPH-dependent glutamate synthase beta subunit-like oxidoreductase